MCRQVSIPCRYGTARRNGFSLTGDRDSLGIPGIRKNGRGLSRSAFKRLTLGACACYLKALAVEPLERIAQHDCFVMLGVFRAIDEGDRFRIAGGFNDSVNHVFRLRFR